MEQKIVTSDVLIIGGGTAGCYAAIKLAERSDLKIVIAEKADIRRSGCLAAGVNALNAYIGKGHTPRDYVKYASADAEGIAREDLLLDISERFNEVTADLEKMGLTILKDKDGNYVSRGWRNIKINGENIKPLLAAAVKSHENIFVYDHVNITDYRFSDGFVYGAYGFGTKDGAFYEFKAGAVLVSTGGAAGLYRPNNPGGSAHQMWYPPFNTGAGYCMGILAGAEMTTFEMRFIALRCKDTIAPTGTLAQGAGAKQINSRGEVYEEKYGLSTSQRLWGTVVENIKGRGPCYLKTEGLDAQKEKSLYNAYLNMAPLQTLKWIDRGRGPSKENVEIEGTEPYIVGGHTAGGYWIGRDRSTTLKGLFAAGDVAGGAPQKYVTGALAEGEIAAEAILDFLSENGIHTSEDPGLSTQAFLKKSEYERLLEQGEAPSEDPITIRHLEDAMQKVMDEYAGGIKTFYKYNKYGLDKALELIEELEAGLYKLHVPDTDGLLEFYELRERLVVAKVLIKHLEARKETRWRGFQENADHPEKNEKYDCYINSFFDGEKIRIIKRDLVRIGE